MNVKDHIRGTSSFQLYRKGYLWYQTDDTGLMFPIPIEDTGDATFSATEKSMLMMRYIRKFLAECEKD